MNTCPEQIVHYMHAYLDGEISRQNERELKEHLETCSACKEIMNRLSESVVFLKSAEEINAPENFVANVMAQLPKRKWQLGRTQRFLRKYPFLVAAALFLVLMSASLFSSYGNNNQFSVTKQPNLIINNGEVIVPKGEVVQGDIIVENGHLNIQGEVKGNVTVINGSKFMASTAIVTGKNEKIDDWFDWLWYKMKDTVKNIFPSSTSEGQHNE